MFLFTNMCPHFCQFCNFSKLTYCSYNLKTDRSFIRHPKTWKSQLFSFLYLLWLLESDLASPLSLHPVFSALRPSSPILPLPLPPPIFFLHSLLIQTYWVRMLFLQRNNEASLLLPSPFLHTLFNIWSYIVCLPVCLPVSFSVPHTSVWQPVATNKKKRITKPNREQIRGRAAGRLVAAFQLWASREGSWYFPYCSHPYVVTYCPYIICLPTYPWIASVEAIEAQSRQWCSQI